MSDIKKNYNKLQFKNKLTRVVLRLKSLIDIWYNTTEGFNMANIFYIDDALGSKNFNLEKRTLGFLQEKMIDSEVTGFGTEGEITQYFSDLNNPTPDLLILDHNLWWNKGDNFPYGYQFRYSDQLVQYLKSIRGEIFYLPKIIFSDDYMATMRYESAAIPFAKFVPKYNDSPWVELAREAQLLLVPPHKAERRL
jgi:hypothetical protein